MLIYRLGKASAQFFLSKKLIHTKPNNHTYKECVRDKPCDRTTTYREGICGRCIIIDAHSFPADPLPYEECSSRRDFCIGTDPFHTPYMLLHTCAQFLKNSGFAIDVNRPFSGTMVPMEHLSVMSM